MLNVMLPKASFLILAEIKYDVAPDNDLINVCSR